MNYDLVTSGYCSLDRIIKVDSSIGVGRTSIITNHNNNEIYFGGCNVNVAVNLARLKMKAAPILRVGNDYESTGFKNYLESNGVVTDTINKLDSHKTSSTYLIETIEHDHITLFYPGAMASELCTPYPDIWFKGTRCALMTVASLNDNREFLKRVKENNLPLFLGMKMDANAFPKEFLKECLDNVEVLFTNENEAKCICEIYELNDYKKLIDVLPKVKTIVITRGKDGSCAQYKENNETTYVEVPIIEVNEVVDTVGSGDAYIAGYIYGYLNGKSIKESMQYGSTLASFVIEGIGSTTASPTKQDLIKRYQNHYNEEN
jgi:adenosine kinase